MSVYIQIGCLCVFTGQPASRQCDLVAASTITACLVLIPQLLVCFRLYRVVLMCSQMTFTHITHRYLCFWVHACTGILKTLFTLNIQHLQAHIQFKDSYRNLVLPLALLLYSSSPSWVVSRCLGQINQPKLTSGSREKDRKGGIYGAGAINRRKGPSAALI